VPQEKKGRLMKNRLLIVKCKTEGCETDLQVGDMPPDDPRGVSRVLAKSIVPNPGKLTCPVCKQKHDYSGEDVGTKSAA